MQETPTTTSTSVIELLKTTSDHARLLERSARLDELEYLLLWIPLPDSPLDLGILHAERINTTS